MSVRSSGNFYFGPSNSAFPFTPSLRPRGGESFCSRTRGLGLLGDICKPFTGWSPFLDPKTGETTPADLMCATIVSQAGRMVSLPQTGGGGGVIVLGKK